MGLKKQIVQSLDLPKEVVLSLPLFSFIGNEELTIENHKGLLSYDTEQILIGTGCGSVQIQGEQLLLKQMSSDCIVIQGIIKQFSFL